jgi:hypothetical protein
MTAEYTLRRADGEPFGSIEQMQSRIRQLFPAVEFAWTPSGLERIAGAAERGVTLSPAVKAALPELPSVLEGVAKGEEFNVTFGLGYQDPVESLYVAVRGFSFELENRLAALEADAGARFSVVEEEW